MDFLSSTLLFCPNPGLPCLNYKLYKLFHIYFLLFFYPVLFWFLLGLTHR